MSVENFLANLDTNAHQTQSILTRYEDDIQKLIDKKIKQTIIIQYLFSVDEEIKNKYDDVKNIKTLKVMVSNFVKKLKSKKRRKLKDECNIDSNSSKPENKEEPEKKSTGILSKIEDKKQEKKSFMPPSSKNDEEILDTKKEEISNFFSTKK